MPSYLGLAFDGVLSSGPKKMQRPQRRYSRGEYYRKMVMFQQAFVLFLRDQSRFMMGDGNDFPQQ